MDTFKSFESQLYDINDLSFQDIALSLFRVQAVNNPIYRNYIQCLKIDVSSISNLSQLPYLPISFFKRHLIQTGSWTPETEFQSSGTTESIPSRHLVKDIQFYLDHSKRCFEFFFGSIKDYHFLALLPSYLERKNSSLVTMMNHFIQESQSSSSGFFRNDYNRLLQTIEVLKKSKRKTVLWGVSFALLELAEKYKPDLSHCIVIETGGMKGRRKELTRAELHQILKSTFHVREIYSEYGMTELLSQCYSRGNEWFYCPPYIKVMVREVTDPFQVGIEAVGGLNIIDLANFNTISFIETEDLGRVARDGSFEVIGRMDNSEARGCNLMVD